MTKDFLEKFESISRFQRALNTRKVDSFYKDRMNSERNSYEFTKTKSYEEADKLLSHGDKDAAAKLIGCNENGKRVNIAKKSTIYNSPIGFVPNVPNYLSGRPDNMFAEKTQTYKSCKVLNVCVNSATSCTVESEDILAFNKRLLNVVYTLEKRGYRLNLYVGDIAYYRTSKNIGLCLVKVKDSGKLLNVTNVAYPLSNPSFGRRHLRRWTETNGETFDSGYGVVASNKKSIGFIKSLFKNANISLLSTEDMLYYSESGIMNVILNGK